MTLKEYFKNRLYNLINEEGTTSKGLARNEEETTKSEVVPKPVETDVDKVVDSTKIDRSERRYAPPPSLARTLLFGAKQKISGPQIDAPGFKGANTETGFNNTLERGTSIESARGLTPEGRAELRRQAEAMDATAKRVREKKYEAAYEKVMNNK